MTVFLVMDDSFIILAACWAALGPERVSEATNQGESWFKVVGGVELEIGLAFGAEFDGADAGAASVLATGAEATVAVAGTSMFPSSWSFTVVESWKETFESY